MIKAIVCTDINFGIGKDNNLLFKLSKDMQYFKEKTLNSVVVCGYKTLLSFPNSKPLPKRSTFVLCSKNREVPENCVAINSFDELLMIIKELSKTQTIWIIGGGKLYKSMLPYCDEVYLNQVSISANADIYFPNIDLDTSFKKEFIKKEIENNLEINYYIYKRIKKESNFND